MLNIMLRITFIRYTSFLCCNLLKIRQEYNNEMTFKITDNMQCDSDFFKKGIICIHLLYFYLSIIPMFSITIHQKYRRIIKSQEFSK